MGQRSSHESDTEYEAPPTKGDDKKRPAPDEGNDNNNNNARIAPLQRAARKLRDGLKEHKGPWTQLLLDSIPDEQIGSYSTLNMLITENPLQLGFYHWLKQRNPNDTDEQLAVRSAYTMNIYIRAAQKISDKLDDTPDPVILDLGNEDVAAIALLLLVSLSEELRRGIDLIRRIIVPGQHAIEWYYKGRICSWYGHLRCDDNADRFPMLDGYLDFSSFVWDAFRIRYEKEREEDVDQEQEMFNDLKAKFMAIAARIHQQ